MIARQTRHSKCDYDSQRFVAIWKEKKKYMVRRYDSYDSSSSISFTLPLDFISFVARAIVKVYIAQKYQSYRALYSNEEQSWKIWYFYYRLS